MDLYMTNLAGIGSRLIGPGMKEPRSRWWTLKEATKNHLCWIQAPSAYLGGLVRKRQAS